MRTVAYCGDYTALTTTKWGAKIYVDTRDTSLAPHIMIEGDWEPWVTDAIAVELQRNPGCLFIDVGANVGWYTLLAAGLGAGHVYAFEPNPRMVELLKKTIAVNGLRQRVTLTQAACGDINGHGYLSVDETEAGGAHLVHPKPGDGPVHAPKLVRLDDAVMARHMSKDGKLVQTLIKIDVEGFEPQVLAGAPEILSCQPLLFLEHNQSEQHLEMYRMLQARGYELRHVRHNGHCSEPFSIEQVMLLGDAETVFCSVPAQAKP